MTSHPTLWSLAAVGSGLAHLTAIAAFQMTQHPDLAAQQPSPESSLTLAAHQVPRSTAQAQRAKSEPGRSATAKGEGLAAGAIPQSQAKPMLAPAANLLAALPQATTLGPAPDPAQPTPSAAISSLALSGIATPGLALSGADPVVAAANPAQPFAEHQSSQPLPQQLAQQLPPKDADLSPLLPDTQSQALSEAAPNPEPAQQSPARVATLTADLAFQGSDPDQIDPLSIAAFQSFTQPENIAKSAKGLRDGVSAVLSGVGCSRLQVVFDPETATLELRGHIPQNDMRAPVLQALQSQMGQDITLSDKMRLLPRPQCGALAGIAAVGLAQSTDQITNPLLLGPEAQARVLSYTGGEQLYFDLTAPDYPAFIYVDYFDAAADVIHLTPNEAIALAQTSPRSALRVGAKSPGDPGLQILVGPPYGQEIAVAFAASSPLYEGLRPLSEPAEEYLTFLRHQIAEKRKQDPDFKGEWVYFLIETQKN